jgi:putative endonuclease
MKTVARHLNTGRYAEQWACHFLRQQGLTLVTRNFRCRTGEIDLVMRDNNQLVFVEVRYRKDKTYGSAAESIDRRKQARVIRCAEYFLQRTAALANLPARFDVISLTVTQNRNDIFETQWIRNAFDAV